MCHFYSCQESDGNFVNCIMSYFQFRFKLELHCVVIKTGNDHKPPLTSTDDYKPSVNDHKLSANDHKPPANDHKPSANNYKGPQSTSKQPQTTTE